MRFHSSSSGLTPARTLRWTSAWAAALLLALGSVAAAAETRPRAGRPTVVLLHGAFAESSSWDEVISPLLRQGYPVRALALPLRGLQADVSYVASQLKGIQGPIVVVGHSWGGMVMSGAAQGNDQVKALVFVAAFAPEEGETAGALAARFPGGTLGPTLEPVALPGGGKDLYIRQDRYHAQFAADLPAQKAAQMAVTQRPIVESSFADRAGAPAWKQIPSWFFFGELDKNIPAAALRFMAERAGGRKIIEVKGASHVVGMSHSAALAKLVTEAAAVTANAPAPQARDVPAR